MKKDLQDSESLTRITSTSSPPPTDFVRNSIESPTNLTPAGSEPVSSSKISLWPGVVSSAFSIFESHGSVSGGSIGGDTSSSSAPPTLTGNSETKAANTTSTTRNHGSSWRTALKRFVSSSAAMRRFQERLLGTSKTGIASSTSDIWFLGVCYKTSSSDDASTPCENSDNNVAAFEQDFSSRILMTYRKGFNAIEDSKFTSDVNWGCMHRSSQMLVAQALLCHRLGRSWRKPLNKPVDQEYIDILHVFGDNEASPFSIHNLIQSGKAYGLAAGSWVGPYAMCRSWETLARVRKAESDHEANSLPMAVYIVSGDEDGERGGAPVVCIEDASRHCFEFSKGQLSWTPILLLVPLVLGLDKINPRYIPLLGATFTFPQSLGILGGKPGTSTYIVGVQDDKAFYLDPHEVQPVVDISSNNLEADTSSYHSNVIRHMPLDLIDPSLAIGFYCRDKDDFDDFCSRASQLADESEGAPLFTVITAHKISNVSGESSDTVPKSDTEDRGDEDDWQIL